MIMRYPAPPSRDRVDDVAWVARALFLTAGAAIGAVVAFFASALWRPETGPLATTAITVVGAIFGATSGVAALVVTHGRRSTSRFE